MKKRFQKTLFIAILLSFIWGLWWGFYRHYRERPENWSGAEIQVLAFDKIFTEEVIKKLAIEEGIDLRVTHISHPQNFLQQMLTSGADYDLIQVNSFLAGSFLIENVFEPLDWEMIPNKQNISIDFQNLSYDPNSQFFLPLFWGVNGFLYDSSVLSSFESLEKLTPQLVLSPSAVEAYTYATRLRPIIKNWLVTGNEEGLKEDLKEISNQWPEFSSSGVQQLVEQKKVAVQITNGRAAEFLKKHHHLRYGLPVEKANLWVGMIGISKDSQNKKIAHQVLNQLLNPKWALEIIKSNQEATVNTLLDNSDSIAPQQKSNFIRELRLSRFELFYDNEAFEPLWSRYLKEFLPQVFKSSIEE